MLQRSDIRRILTDLYRTELSHSHPEASVDCQETAESLWAKIPLDLKQQTDAKAAALFGYSPRSFSLFERMVDYCYASFLKNGRLVFTVSTANAATPQQRIVTTEMMWKESREVAALFPDTKRIISLVPCTDWYGFLFGAELPHILQVPLISLPDQPAQEWNVKLQAGDLVVATPKFWNYWLRCGNQFPREVEVVCATAPCNEELTSQLSAVGVARVTDMYGSSLTGPLGFRQQVKSPFKMFSFWNVSLSQGSIRLKHASRAEWVTLPPKIEIGNDREFYPLAQRVTENPNENNLVDSLHQIEQVLVSHPAVRACRVRPVSSQPNSRLEAFVALHDGYTPSHLSIIRTFLRQHLPAAAIPDAFVFDKPVVATGQ